MNKIISFLKKEPMLTVSVAAAAAAMIITPPTTALFIGIDWRTPATLFMMLTVLEGFKKENIFRPVLKLSGKIKTCWGLSMFLVFSVFFSSMFVTNDVSLIIFVPLTADTVCDIHIPQGHTRSKRNIGRYVICGRVEQSPPHTADNIHDIILYDNMDYCQPNVILGSNCGDNAYSGTDNGQKDPHQNGLYTTAYVFKFFYLFVVGCVERSDT